MAKCSAIKEGKKMSNTWVAFGQMLKWICIWVNVSPNYIGLIESYLSHCWAKMVWKHWCCEWTAVLTTQWNFSNLDRHSWMAQREHVWIWHFWSLQIHFILYASNNSSKRNEHFEMIETERHSKPYVHRMPGKDEEG